MTPRPLDSVKYPSSGSKVWDFSTVHFWGETLEGVWKLSAKTDNEYTTQGKKKIQSNEHKLQIRNFYIKRYIDIIMSYHNVRHNIVFNFSVTLKSWMITFYGFRKGKFMVIKHSP